MNLLKYPLWGVLAASTLVAASAAAHEPRKPERSRERAERPTETPYSNRSVQRQREIREIARKIESDRKPDHYRFNDEEENPE